MELANAQYQSSIEQLNSLTQEQRKNILNPKNKKTTIDVGISTSEGENANLLNEIYSLSSTLDETPKEDWKGVDYAVKLQEKKKELSKRLGIDVAGLDAALSGKIYSNTIGSAPKPEEIREYEVGFKETPVTTGSTQERRKAGQLFYNNLFDYYQNNPKAASIAFSQTFTDLPDATGARKASQYDFEMNKFMIETGKEAARDNQGVLYTPEGAKDVDVNSLKSQYLKNLKGLSQQATEKFITLTPSASDRAKLESGQMSQEEFSKKYNYENIVKNIQKQLDLVDQYVLSDEDKKKIASGVKNQYTFIADVTGAFGGKEYRDKNPLYKGLNDYQKIYLESLRVSDPEKYENRLRLLTTPVELIKQETGKWNPDLQMGYESKMKEAEDEGIAMAELDYLSRIENLASKDKKGTITKEEKLQLTNLLAEYDELQKYKDTQIARYPVAAKQEIIDNIGKATGNVKLSGVERFGYGVASGIGNAADWMFEVVSAPFSDKDSRIADLENIGNDAIYQSYKNRGWKDESVVESPYQYLINPEFKKRVDQIESDSKLTPEEKYNAKVNAFMDYRKQNGENPVVITKNPNAGDINLSATAILNTTSDVAEQLISQFALAAGSGGFGNISKIRSLATLFGSTFAISIKNYEAEALNAGRNDVTSYAIRKATIDGLTELFGDDLVRIKSLFKGKGAVGKIVDSITDQEWKAVLRATAKTPSKIKNFVASLPMKALKPAATESFEEGMANTLNNLFDGKPLGEGLKETIATTGIGTFATMGVGSVFSYRSFTNSQKVDLYNAGVNADKYIKSLESQLANGEIDAKDAQKKRLVIEEMSRILDNLPKTDENGNQLSDKALVDLAFNKYMEVQAQKAKKENPKSIKVDELVDQIQQDNADILSGEPQIVVFPEEEAPTGEEVKPEVPAEQEVKPEVAKAGEVTPEVPKVPVEALKDVESTTKAFERKAEGKFNKGEFEETPTALDTDFGGITWQQSNLSAFNKGSDGKTYITDKDGGVYEISKTKLSFNNTFVVKVKDRNGTEVGFFEFKKDKDGKFFAEEAYTSKKKKV